MKVHLLNSKKKKIVFATIIIAFVAILTCVILIIVNVSIKNNEKIKIDKLRETLSEISKASASKKSTAVVAPESGEIQYKFIQEETLSDGSGTRYIYYTIERAEERLIELNEKIIGELRQSGKITDDTSVYYIDYFNDEAVAKTYYNKINDKTTSSSEKLSMIGSITASMSYHKNLGINQLAYSFGLKVIKKY